MRPIIRYHGGKWKLAEWIISNLPPHRVYVEPFGGAASVLMRKNRSYCEVYNDLDGEVVNLFRVMRNPDTASRLRDMLELTPFAREEFAAAYSISSDPIEQARLTIVKSFMGFGSAAVTARDNGKAPTGFRANSNRSGTTPAHDWRNYPSGIPFYIDRLQGVVIEHREASDVIAAHDGKETLFYVDPPYCSDTRDTGSDYRFEMTDGQHRELSETLRAVRGMVVLSGYPSALYRGIYDDWYSLERNAMADGARARVECLWFNPAANEMLNQKSFEFSQ